MLTLFSDSNAKYLLHRSMKDILSDNDKLSNSYHPVFLAIHRCNCIIQTWDVAIKLNNVIGIYLTHKHSKYNIWIIKLQITYLEFMCNISH